jgi:hypothetical protein
MTTDVDSIPSINRRSNQARKSHDRNIPPIVYKSTANRLGRVTTPS